jgi:hypothetical protein
MIPAVLFPPPSPPPQKKKKERENLFICGVKPLIFFLLIDKKSIVSYCVATS